LPVVGASPAPYHPALTKRDTMSNEGHPAVVPPPKHSRALRLLWILSFIVIAGGVGFAVVTAIDGKQGAEPPRNEASPAPSTSQTTTSIESQMELVARLEEILARREAAYSSRNPKILEEIYTSDCPCLEAIPTLFANSLAKVTSGSVERPLLAFDACRK
jgi:hypothetical protein